MAGETIKFLQSLKQLDKDHLSPRDVLLIYSVMSMPGTNGREIQLLLGLKDRSGVSTVIRRMILAGLIEDRRVEIRQASPCMLHITPAGREYWNSIKP